MKGSTAAPVVVVAGPTIVRNKAVAYPCLAACDALRLRRSQ